MDHTLTLVSDHLKGSHSESLNSVPTSPETSNDSLYEAVEEDDEMLKLPPVTKKIQKIPYKKKKKYRTISDSLREKLIEAVEKGEKIKHAAKKFNINYSSAKSICQVFKKEGRSSKKTFKIRGGHSNHPQALKKSSFDSGPSLFKSESEMSPENTKTESAVRTRGSLKVEANQEAPTCFKHSSPEITDNNTSLLKPKQLEDHKEKSGNYSDLLQHSAEENEKLNSILAQNSVLMNKSLHHQPSPQSLVIHTPQVFMQNNFNNISPSSNLLNNFQMQRINATPPQINLSKHSNINSYNFPLLSSLINSGFDSTGLSHNGISSLVSRNYQFAQYPQVQNPHMNSLLLNNQAQLNDLANIQSLLMNQMNQQSRNINPFQKNFY